MLWEREGLGIGDIKGILNTDFNFIYCGGTG